MRDHDPALDKAIQLAAAIFGDVLVRLHFPESPPLSVDFPETESVHVTGG
ncbi:MAG: hypothetical protein ABI972_28155 [Acidobacteriota bacterium]